MRQVVIDDSAALSREARRAMPGTRLLLAPRVFGGGIYLENLIGRPEAPIVLASVDPARPAIIEGGSNGLHLSKVRHVVIRDLQIRKSSANGLSVDDGGKAGASTSVSLENLTISQIGRGGNHDGVKLSGIDDFSVRGCRVRAWGSQGSGIDMVGCHRGVIESCTFEEGGSEGIQAKGGCDEIRIVRCRFRDFGERGINIGGSTGFPFFRPPVESMPVGRRFEAKNIRVEGCTFSGGVAAIAFVGVDGAQVRFNTIWHPRKWALRILQETTDSSFVACRDGVFSDNIIVFSSASWSEGGVNIGPGTSPQSFRFARNVWFCDDSPQRSRPRLPTTETDAIVGRDPGFVDPTRGDFSLGAGSAAFGRGAAGIPENASPFRTR